RSKRNDLRCRVLCRTPGSFDRWPLARRSACPNTRVFGLSPSQNALSPAPGERVVHQTLTYIERIDVSKDEFSSVTVTFHARIDVPQFTQLGPIPPLSDRKRTPSHEPIRVKGEDPALPVPLLQELGEVPLDL